MEPANRGCLLENCKELYEYFRKNLDKIVHNDELSYKIGSAFYFMGAIINDKQSQEYKFAMLASFINLYKALSSKDIQASIAAHRLFLLITMDGKSEKPFFDLRLVAQLYHLEELLVPYPENHSKRISMLKIFVYNYLSQFINGYDSATLSLLSSEEQGLFKKEYGNIQNRLEQNQQSRTVIIQKGSKVLSAISNELQEEIGGIKYLGIIV